MPEHHYHHQLAHLGHVVPEHHLLGDPHPVEVGHELPGAEVPPGEDALAAPGDVGGPDVDRASLVRLHRVWMLADMTDDNRSWCYGMCLIPDVRCIGYPPPPDCLVGQSLGPDLLDPLIAPL